MTPEHALAQRRSALQRANDVRHFRKLLKDGIHAGEVRVSGLLLGPDPRLDTMRIADLLRAVPMLGGRKCKVMMRSAGNIGELRTIGQVSGRQRGALSSLVFEHEERFA